jgi:hypothetical protein
MTQKKAILSHLKKYKRISPVTALKEYGCYRLAARIHELRKEGYEIEKFQKISKNRYGNKVNISYYFILDR